MRKRKEDRVALRATDDLRRELERVCESLGRPWTLSSVVERAIGLFLADGVVVAADRIRSRRWGDDDQEERIREIVRLTVEELVGADGLMRLAAIRVADNAERESPIESEADEGTGPENGGKAG